MVKKYSFLFIVLAAIMWSIDGILRRSLYSLPPAVIVLFEHVLGFLLLVPFLLPKISEIKKLNRKDFYAFLWVAFLSGVVGTLLYTAALGKVNYINFSVVVLLQKLQPLFVVSFAWLVLKEKVTADYFKWAALAIAAAYLVSFPNMVVNLSQDSGQVIAALLAVGAAFAWGSSTAFSRFTLQKLTPIVTTGIRFGLTIPIALVFVFLTNSQAKVTAISTTQLLTLLGITLTTGMVALVIYYRGLKFTQAKVSAIAELAWPISALLIGYFFYHERLTITQGIGAALLLFSMYKVGILQKHEDEQHTYSS